MEDQCIYVITGIHFGIKYIDKEPSGDGKYHSYLTRTKEDQEEKFSIIDSRTWGYYLDLEIAKKCVENNICDLHEDIYDMVVIESIKPGMIQVPEEEYWYEWVSNKYVESKKPEEYRNVVNFWEFKKRMKERN